MYYIFSVLITAAAVYLAVADIFFFGTSADRGERSYKSTKTKRPPLFKAPKKAAMLHKFATSFVSASGILLSGAVTLTLNLRLNASGLDGEYVSWAKDMFTGYVRFGTVFFLIVSAVSILSFLVDRRHKTARALLPPFASVIILITGILYSYIASSDTVALSAYVQLFSMGMASAVLFPLAFDFQRTENSFIKTGEDAIS